MALSLYSPLSILITVALASQALAQQDETREYQDGARGVVILPQGDKSFADVVVSYTAGTGRISDTASDPRAVLGPPNFSGNVNDGSFLSLGCDGSVVVQFTDNALINVDGPDLYVFEVGPNVEGMNLAISEDGTTWIDLGDISGGRAEVELAGLVSEGGSFRFVRLTDDGEGCETNFAGADIDAVAAIGSTLRFVLDGSVLFATDSTELRAEAQNALVMLAQDIAAANLRDFRVVGHTDSIGSDAYNLALSQARALAVRDYLQAQSILSAATITAEGRGEAEPIADNTTVEGQSQNRRVEIIGN
jgi:outer membrane protein OmpA-like peptidoglycan-associated protein